MHTPQFMRRALACAVLLPFAACSRPATAQVADDPTARAAGLAVSQALRFRKTQLRDSVPFTNCGLDEALGHRNSAFRFLALDAQQGMAYKADSLCITLVPENILAVHEVWVQQGPSRLPTIAVIRFRRWEQGGQFREEEYAIVSNDGQEWTILDASLRPASRTPSANSIGRGNPDGFIVHNRQLAPSPFVILNNRVVPPTEVDSVLRSLQSAIVDSVRLLPIGTPATQLCGSRCSDVGAIIIGTRKP